MLKLSVIRAWGVAVASGAVLALSGCDGDCERRSLRSIDAEISVSGLSVDLTGVPADEGSLPDPYFRVRLLHLTNGGDGQSLNSPVQENTEQIGPITIDGSFTTKTYGVGYRVLVFDADTQSEDDELCRTPDIRMSLPNPDDEPADITQEVTLNCSGANAIYPLDFVVVLSNLKAGYKTGEETCPYNKCTKEKVNIADVRLSGLSYSISATPDDDSEGLNGDLFLETTMETEDIFQKDRLVTTDVIDNAPNEGNFTEQFSFYGTRFQEWIDFYFDLIDEDFLADDTLGVFSYSVNIDDLEKPDTSLTFQDTDSYNGQTAIGTSFISIDLDFFNIRTLKDEVCPVKDDS